MSEQNLNQEEQVIEEKKTFMQAIFTGKGRIWRIVIVSLALVYIVYGLFLGITN